MRCTVNILINVKNMVISKIRSELGRKSIRYRGPAAVFWNTGQPSADIKLISDFKEFKSTVSAMVHFRDHPV